MTRKNLADEPADEDLDRQIADLQAKLSELKAKKNKTYPTRAIKTEGEVFIPDPPSERS